jgi:hypothetical protein
MTDLLEDYTQDQDSENIISVWEVLKATIKERTIAFATPINRERKDRERYLVDTILLMKRNNNKSPDIVVLQEELEQIRQHIYKGALIRSRIQCQLPEEPTRHFLAVEQNIQKKRSITEVMDMQGNMQTNTHDVTQAFEDYYRDLYTETEVNPEGQNRYMQYAHKLEEEARDTRF